MRECNNSKIHISSNFLLSKSHIIIGQNDERADTTNQILAFRIMNCERAYKLVRMNTTIS